jgi:hypothetical protein
MLLRSPGAVTTGILVDLVRPAAAFAFSGAESALTGGRLLVLLGSDHALSHVDESYVLRRRICHSA